MSRFTMRKRQFLALFGLSFFTWAAITYYLFAQRPLHAGTKTTGIDGVLAKAEFQLAQQGFELPSGDNIPVAPNKRTADLQLKLHELEAELKDQYKANEDLLHTLRDMQRSSGRKAGLLSAQQNRLHKTLAKAALGRPVIAVLVFACNRITVKRNIDQLIRYRPSAEKFPIIVTQDCQHQQTSDVIKSYGDQLIHIQQPDQSEFNLAQKEKKFKGYYKISRHYGWALNQTFNHFNHQTAIIVEDDLDIAPDFFEYFLATYPLLRLDSTLWCVSAWNDNGKDGFVEDNPELLYRTDFFPGLGWMLTRELWDELQPKWPKAYWDDWIRAPEQRRNRSCIRPEISRTKTFGRIGVSNGLFFDKHLKFIKLNDKFVPFTQRDVTYLYKDRYDEKFLQSVYNSPEVSLDNVKRDKLTQPKGQSLRLTYDTVQSYKKLTKALGLMDDLKAGVPRTGYLGIVTFYMKERRIYIAPSSDWNGYNIEWS